MEQVLRRRCWITLKAAAMTNEAKHQHGFLLVGLSNGCNEGGLCHFVSWVEKQSRLRLSPYVDRTAATGAFHKKVMQVTY
jgi:hypothetical protein